MSDQMPFDVPIHNTMVVRVAGKMPLTVLTIELMIFSIRICEYTDPLFIGRAWWYKHLEDAINAFVLFMESPGNEPAGWLRADDFDEDGSPRTRRAHVEFGERVITVDGEEND